MLRFWLWHVEELTLYVGVVPVVALVVLLARGPRRCRLRLQEHLAATVALVVTSTLVVAAFASRFASDRVQDRYLFFLRAALLVGRALAWVALGAPRPRGRRSPSASALARRARRRVPVRALHRRAGEVGHASG